MMDYVGCHYSEIAEELVAQYGEFVARQLEYVAMGEDSPVELMVDLCSDGGAVYSAHYVLWFDDDGYVEMQDYVDDCD